MENEGSDYLLFSNREYSKRLPETFVDGLNAEGWETKVSAKIYKSREDLGRL